MNHFKVGFARNVINPPMGIEIDGYYKIRKVEGILDDLEINTLALFYKEQKIVLISVDHCGIETTITNKIIDEVSKATGIPENAVIVGATHTHTAPYMRSCSTDQLEINYTNFVIKSAVKSALLAIDDLKSSNIGWGIGTAPRVAFMRRFRMKDGSIQTNPGVNNSDIIAPIGDVDERVNVIRFDREDAESIVLVNFGNHPDTIGGNKASADWPGFLRRTVEKAIDNSKCIFFNGALGDVNHINVHPKDGEMNGMVVDFDDVARGYSHAKHIGNVVAGAVLQVYEKVKYVDVYNLNVIKKQIQIASNRATKEEIIEAKRINDLYMAGRDNELPYEGMMLTTVVAEAARMVLLENGPDFFTLDMSCLSIGPIALISIPGEAFTGIGVGLKETTGFDIILPLGLTNGYEGYFPMQDSYDEGGYEARSSIFKAGVGECIIKEGKALLEDIRE